MLRWLSLLRCCAYKDAIRVLEQVEYGGIQLLVPNLIWPGFRATPVPALQDAQEAP